MTQKGGIHIELPQDVKDMIARLREAGFEAYAVGGCIRDSLLGREPEDWDITTSAKPEEIKSVFEKTVDTGIKHGTVTVLIRQEPEQRGGRYEFSSYEVTTYRLDGEYKDGRHPEKVRFTPSLVEDLRRRDFTVNAMAYNDESGLIDEFGGLSDMDLRRIKCVGDPDERFSEDALRLLRAVRFMAQLGFAIEDETEEAIRRHAENLKNVSKERIYAELTKLVCSEHPEALSELEKLSMKCYICEGFSELHLSIFDELKGRAGYTEVPFEEKHKRYAILLSETGVEGTRRMLRELRSDNVTIKKTSLLVKYLFISIESSGYAIKLVMQEMDEELFSELLELKELFSETRHYKESCPKEDVSELRSLFEKLIARDEPIYMKDLLVKGSDLIKAGYKPGKEIGEILSSMHDDVMRHPEHNSILYLFSKYLSQ